MHTETNHSVPEFGPVQTAAHPDVDRMVQLTAMHATFTLQSVTEWLLRDQMRQEGGTPDSLAYLVEAMRFLITVGERNTAFAQICRKQQTDKQVLFQGLESTLPVLKSIKMDTSNAEAQCRTLRLQAAQLEACAANQEGSVGQLTGLFDMLQQRVEAVTRAPGRVAEALPAN